MGSDSSKPAIQQTAADESQLQTQIGECIKLKRLHFSHQSNIFIKFEYLVRHFAQFQIEELLLGITDINPGKTCDNQQDHNMIRTEVVELLAKIDLKNTKEKIKVICLSYNEMDCQSVKPIVNFDLLHLTTLYLDHNLIGNDGCYYLTKPKLQSLQTLDLTSNAITEDGSRFLAMGNWPHLRTLLISENKLTAKGFLFLSKGEWPHLIFVQAKTNAFQVTKNLQNTKFRTEVKGFTIQLR